MARRGAKNRMYRERPGTLKLLEHTSQMFVTLATLALSRISQSSLKLIVKSVDCVMIG